VSADSRWITTAATRVGFVAAENALFYPARQPPLLLLFEPLNEGAVGRIGDSKFVGPKPTAATLNSIEYALRLTGRRKSSTISWVYATRALQCRLVSPGFPGGDTFSTSNRDLQMLTVGFNYLFNGRQ
jgi:hypothetical protein